jgi:hypothetical protein
VRTIRADNSIRCVYFTGFQGHRTDIAIYFNNLRPKLHHDLGRGIRPVWGNFYLTFHASWEVYGCVVKYIEEVFVLNDIGESRSEGYSITDQNLDEMSSSIFQHLGIPAIGTEKAVFWRIIWSRISVNEIAKEEVRHL